MLSLDQAKNLCQAMVMFVQETAPADAGRLDAAYIVERLLLAFIDEADADQTPADTIVENTDYEVFGLHADCNDEELRAAYLAKVRSFHPDNLHDVPDEILHFATAKMQTFNAAYARLVAAR